MRRCEMKEALKLLVISLMMVILEPDSPETVGKYFWDSFRRVHFVQELEDKITAYIGESEEIDLLELSKAVGVTDLGHLRKILGDLMEKRKIKEFLEVVDSENGLPKIDENTGLPILKNILKTKSKIHQDGDWHITVHTVVVDKWGNVLLQKIKKDGRLDISASGHWRTGESYEKGAIRELGEETEGIAAGFRPERFKKAGIFLKIGDGEVEGDTVESTSLGNIFRYRDTKKVNREVSILYAYVVDALEKRKDGIYLRFQKESQKISPGEEADSLSVEQLEVLENKFSALSEQFRSGIRQYWHKDIFPLFRSLVKENILDAIRIEKFVLQENETFELVVAEYMNGRIKADRTSGKTAYREENGQVNQDEKLEEIRRGFPILEDLIKKFENETGKQVRAVIPNGNLLINDWFVGWKDGVVFHRMDEPFLNRSYPMLVRWKNGGVSFENIRFVKEENSERYRVISDERGDITEGVEFATFGQTIINNGKKVPLLDVIEKFEDLRHLFTFPRIKLSKMRELGFNISGNLSGSFYFGANYLVGKSDLLEKSAQSGVVKLNIKDVFLEFLKAHDLEAISKFENHYSSLKQMLIEGLVAADYRETVKGVDELFWGEYRIIGDELYIKFKEGIYPHTAIGIKDDGEIVMYAIDGFSGRLGASYEQIQELLLRDGVEKAILIANGGDVVLKVGNSYIIPSPEGRERFSSAIFVVKK